MPDKNDSVVAASSRLHPYTRRPAADVTGKIATSSRVVYCQNDAACHESGRGPAPRMASSPSTRAPAMPDEQPEPTRPHLGAERDGGRLPQIAGVPAALLWPAARTGRAAALLLPVAGQGAVRVHERV